MKAEDKEVSATVPHLTAKLQNNSLGIQGANDECIGKALYLMASFCNHSCAPTCVAAYSGTRIQVPLCPVLPEQYFCFVSFDRFCALPDGGLL